MTLTTRRTTRRRRPPVAGCQPGRSFLVSGEGVGGGTQHVREPTR